MIKNPWPKNKTLMVLLMIWSFPTLLLSFLFVIFPLFVFKQIDLPAKWNYGAFDIMCKEDSKLFKYMFGNFWSAFSIGWFIIYRDKLILNNLEVMVHERQHLKQQYILSIFQWIFYGLFCIIIWISCPNLHAYKANPFELDARREAGQDTKDIGPIFKDRWPWW